MSVMLKAAACLPVIGPFVASYKIYSSKWNQAQPATPQGIINGIEERNHYKIAGLVSNLLNLALIIAGIALGIFSSPLGIVIGVAFTAVILASSANYFFEIFINKAYITGMQSGINQTGINPITFPLTAPQRGCY